MDPVDETFVIISLQNETEYNPQLLHSTDYLGISKLGVWLLFHCEMFQKPTPQENCIAL